MSFLNIDKEAMKESACSESYAIAAEMLWQDIKEQAENIAKTWIRTYYTRRRKASGKYLITRSTFDRNQPVITIKHGLQWLLCEMQPDLSKHKDILNAIVEYLRVSKGERTACRALSGVYKGTYQIDLNIQ
jgi:hypothetical protein